jgi:plasmid stability protein
VCELNLPLAMAGELLEPASCRLCRVRAAAHARSVLSEAATVTLLAALMAARVISSARSV